MRKRIYSILLAIALLATIIPITVLAENPPHTHDGYTAISNATELAALFTKGGSGYLTADITTNSEASRLIKAGKTVNLCLNGFVLTLGYNNNQNIGIEGSGVLNLYDCGTTTHKFSVGTNGLWILDETSGTETVTGGVITGGKGGGGIAGAVYMASGAQFNMYGGNIVGNQASDICGAVYVDGTSVFNMTGGNIIGNQASGNGGAVYAAGTSVFNMSGGTIAGNIAGGLSGAIHIEAGAIFNLSDGTIDSNKSNSWGGAVCSYGIFNMTGGAITNNTSTQGGGGISISDNSTFSMSGGEISGCISGNEGGGACIGRDGVNLSIGGTAVITGNKRNSTTENLYLRTGGTSRLGVNTPAEGMSVGITMQTPGQFTNTTATSSDEQYFTSDNNNYRVKYKPDGFLQLENTTIADVLVTNADFPTSDSWNTVPENAWENDNRATAHLATNALHLLCQGNGMSTDVTATVTFENGNYVYTYGSTIITFNMTDDVLESITVSGMSEKLDGTYKPVTYYTVTFDTDGGSAIDAQGVISGKTVNKPTDPTKEGYTFFRWLDKDGKPFDFSTPITEDITLKASWLMDTYSVKFYRCVGDETPFCFYNVSYNNTIGNAPSPTREGYIFKGWYYNGKPFDFNTKVTCDMDVYAEWEAIAHDYKITEGAHASWLPKYAKGFLSFRSNADYSKFVSVEVDNKILDASKFIASPGSTIVKLKPEYLSTLAIGKHTLRIVSTDGYAETDFYIEETIANTDGEEFALSTATMSSAFIGCNIVGLAAIFFEIKKRKAR